jgi:3-deoxy-D-manno-octulosonic-acid transferase
MMMSLYRFLTNLGFPLIWFYLSRRLANGKECHLRFTERLGDASIRRPEGLVVWFHGASVGESLSMLPLIKRLRTDHPEWNILVTTGTVTSASLMVERLPDGAFHQFIPVDRVAYISKFFNHWKPDLALWTESEFWPNIISRFATSNVPMVLLNGRISDKSLRRWKYFPGLIKEILSAFSLCLGQSEGDAFRLSELGATNSKSVGNLKFSTPPLAADQEAMKKLSLSIGQRPCWLASSTHKGDEEIVGRIHKSLKNKQPEILSIIVPRHPGRGSVIAEKLKNMGLSVTLRSKNGAINTTTDIYIADTLGELGIFYRLAPIVYIGKSLVSVGGQNPLEAARLDCAIVFGKRMDNFKEITTKLTKKNACIEVSDENSLLRTIKRLIETPEECRQLATAARQFTEEQSGVLEVVLHELQPFLLRGR